MSLNSSGPTKPPRRRVDQLETHPSGPLNALKVNSNRKIYAHFLMGIGYILGTFRFYLPRGDYLYGLGGCNFGQLSCNRLRETFVKRPIIIVNTAKWHYGNILVRWNRMEAMVHPSGNRQKP